MSAANLKKITLIPHWTLKSNEPKLYKKLLALEPSLEEAHNLMPIPCQQRALTTQSFMQIQPNSIDLVRPFRHWRAVYWKLREGKGYLAIKGSEAFAENVPELLANVQSLHSICNWSFRKSGRGPHSNDAALLPMHDRYLYLENKIPLLYQLSEAMAETQSSVQLQNAYVDSYQELPKLPIPISVFKLSEKNLAALYPVFKHFYDAERFTLVEERMHKGIAVKTYWYPILPQRIGHIELATADSAYAFQDRLLSLGQFMNVAHCIENLILLFCRILNLGYLPTDPTSACKGYCIDPGNIVLDGGMVDTASVRSINSFKYEGEIHFVFQNAIRLLQEGILSLLVGPGASDFGHSALLPDLQPLLYKKLEMTAQEDLNHKRFVHPVIKKLLSAPPTYIELLTQLAYFFEL